MLTAMNLHWGGTLSQSWVVKTHNKRNYTISFPYNYTEYKNSKEKQYWDDFFARNRTANNHSALYADNNFMRKTRLLSDMMERSVSSQNFTTVVVIASIFLCFTLSITVAVAVFCRKKNAVFALQKSEQEDADMELDDLNTDVELTETEFDSEIDNLCTVHRSRSLNHLDPSGADSAVRRPLVGGSGVEDSPVISQKVYGTGRGSGRDDRGVYQRMVVTALLEKPHSDSEDSAAEPKLNRRLNKKYYGIAAVSSDLDSDLDASPLHKPHKVITVSVDNHETRVDSHVMQINASNDKDAPQKRPSDACILYVNLPTDEKDMPEPGSVICVTLPVKDATCTHNASYTPARTQQQLSHLWAPSKQDSSIMQSTVTSEKPPTSPTSKELLHSPQSYTLPRDDIDTYLDLGSPTDLPASTPLVYSSSADFKYHSASTDSHPTITGPPALSPSHFPKNPPKKDIASMFQVSTLRSQFKGDAKPRSSWPKSQQCSKPVGAESSNLPDTPVPSPATPLDETFVLNMDGSDFCSESENLVSKDALALAH